MHLDTPKWLHDEDNQCLRLVGADVFKFLQSKLTANVNIWKTGKAYYAMSTNINGQVLFDGEFFVVDNETVDVWLPEGSVEAAVEHIEKYVIMEDVTVTRQERESWLLFGDDEDALADELDKVAKPSETSGNWQGDHDEAYIFRRPRAVMPSFRVVEPAKISVEFSGTIDDRPQLTPDELHAEEIRRGFPRFGRDFFAEKTIPLEAGLFEGVDFNKGCYLGQEVIERLHSRGTPARRLAHIRWDGPPVPADTDIDADGRNGGTITSAVEDGNRSIGLAYIRRKYLDDIGSLRVAGSDSPIELLKIYGGSDEDE
jgi:folate-binding protein YgfZ